MNKDYDYIIAGSGLAGLSLLYHVLQHDVLKTKKILVVDPMKKKDNDRTWCFWEKQQGPFESIVCHQWKTLRFFSHDVEREFEMENYRYKMIQSGDLYQLTQEHACGFPNVVFIHEKIFDIVEKDNLAIVKTDVKEYAADYVFNSTGLFHPEMNEQNTLLQHFTGWYIKTAKPAFNSSIATLMDFRLNQKHGTTFMYVLPTKDNEALVEYTLFSEKVLKPEEYERELRRYIREDLKVEDYEITHTEFGVIPMSKAGFNRYQGKNNRIINIGTAGGFTKPSTGYTFQFVQKHLEEVAICLKNNQSPAIKPTWTDKKFLWYDLTLLDVLMTGSLTGEKIFTSLFKKVKPERILAFLANDSGFWEEFKIRNAVPVIPFFLSGMKQLLGGKQTANP